MRALLLTALVLLPSPALAHSSRSGWVYPNTCCRNHQDCHWIERHKVTRTDTGYSITIEPSDHDHLTKTMTIHVLFKDALPAGDRDYHMCIGKWDIFRCFYAPPDAFT